MKETGYAKKNMSHYCVMLFPDLQFDHNLHKKIY